MSNKRFLIFFMMTLSFSSYGTRLEYFITTWDAKLDSNNNIKITIPHNPDYLYSYDVDWNYDGNNFNPNDTGIDGDATNDYTVEGVKTIAIRGNFPAISLDRLAPVQRNGLLSVLQWGTGSWLSMESAFHEAHNLQVLATDKPDLSQVRSMKGMFYLATNVDPYVSNWDTSSVTDMSSMFSGASKANPDLSGWDTSSVTDMSSMFRGTQLANPDVSGWVTTSVTNMRGMFIDAIAAEPITITDSSLGVWDTSSVTDMNSMFRGAIKANPDVSGWDISSVSDMQYMFANTSNTTGNISSWLIDSLPDMSTIKFNSSWTIEIYDEILVRFAEQVGNLGVSINLGAGASTYCSQDAIDARNLLINHNSDIDDDGFNCNTINPTFAPMLDENYDTGRSSTDNITNLTTIVIHAICSTLDNPVNLYEGLGLPIQDSVLLATETCDGTMASFTITDLDENNYGFFYTESFDGIDSLTSPTLTVQVIASEPNHPVIFAPIDGALTNEKKPMFHGFVSNLGTQIIITGPNNALCDSGIIEVILARWDCTFDQPLIEGVNELNIYVEDVAGNVLNAPYTLEVNTSINYGLDISTASTPVLTDESGSTAAISLTLPLTPTDDVIINISSSNTSEGVIDTESVLFRAEDWTQDSSVNLTGVDDLIPDGDQEYFITFDLSLSIDPKYAALEPISIDAINVDDEPHLDLSVELSNCTTQVNPGYHSKYKLIVANPGAQDVSNALVSLGSYENLEIDYWDCSFHGPGNASCGSIDHGVGTFSDIEVSIDQGEQLVFTIFTTTELELGLSTSLTALVEAPSSGLDIRLDNNQDSDIDIIQPYIYMSSFEPTEVGCI